jgi:hypothetical protein
LPTLLALRRGLQATGAIAHRVTSRAKASPSIIVPFLAYYDESGDAGIVGSPTKYFVLSCVLVHEKQWLSTLDQLISMRRRMRELHKLPTRPEIKSTDIRRGRGPLLHLRWSPERRMQFYQNVMRYQANTLTDLTIFAVAIEKGPAQVNGREPRETAWEFAIQRVNRFCDDERAIFFPDEGHFPFIRRLLRRMRRFQNVPRRWGGGSLSVPTARIVEDPSDRRHHRPARRPRQRLHRVAPGVRAASDVVGQLRRAAARAASGGAIRSLVG